MAVKNHNALLKKLKKQVRDLQKKEEISRNKLRAALDKVRKLGRAYKRKLASKMHVMKSRIAKSHATAYAKIAADIERQMLKSIEAKSRAIALAVAKLEKKHVTRLTRRVVKKGKVKGK